MESHKIIQVDEKVPFNLLIPLTLSGSTIENWNDGGSHAGDAKM